VKVLGLDPSLTSFGLCEVDVMDDNATQWTMTSHVFKSKYKGVSRLVDIRYHLDQVIAEVEPDLVVLEGYAFARPNQAHQIGELGGMIRLLLDGHKLEPLIVPPTKLKKFVTGKGNAKKDLMLMYTSKRFGVEFDNSDESDAFGLAMFGAMQQGWCDVPLPQANLDALELKENSDE